MTSPEFQEELERARRYERTFAFLRIVLPVDATRMSDGQVADLRLRANDRVWRGGDAIYVLAPEMGREGIARLEARVWEAHPGSRVEAVCFPADGMTSRGLLAGLLSAHDRPVPLADKRGVRPETRWVAR